MIKAIIFDFDGVLVESVDIKTNAFAGLFEREGEVIVDKVVKYHLDNGGVSRFDKFRYIYKNILKRELTDKIFSNLCDKFAELVVEGVISAPYVNGAKEFLSQYLNHYKFFLISATPQNEIMHILQKRNLSGYFNKIYGAPKKKPDCVKLILRDNGLLADETIYIGDALSDYEAARVNKIRFIARINNNEGIFSGKMVSYRLNDLVNLNEIIKNL